MDMELLKKIPLFENLNTEQLALIASLGKLAEYGKGKTIFKEGDRGHALFIIAEGRVRISKNIPGVGEEALIILEEGDYFGEMALVDDSPRSADALAHTTSKLFEINKEELEQMLFVNHELACEILWSFVRTLAGRLRQTNEKIKKLFLMHLF